MIIVGESGLVVASLVVRVTSSERCQLPLWDLRAMKRRPLSSWKSLDFREDSGILAVSIPLSVLFTRYLLPPSPLTHSAAQLF